MATSRSRKAEGTATPVPGRTIDIVLTVLVLVTAWLWFHFHVRRHVASWAFGGVTAVAALAFAWVAWKAFAGEELKTLPQRWLAWRHTRATVVALFAATLAAHLLTGSLHINLDAEKSGKGGSVIADLTRDGRVVKTVRLDGEHKEAALTYPVWLSPVRVGIATRSPRGYKPEVVEAGRFVRAIRLPQAEWEKKYNLVRLAPGMFLFALRGAAPDPSYRLDFYVNGTPVRQLDRLGFQTIYLGGSAEDLAAIPDLHGDARHKGQLERFLLALDSSIPDEARQRMIQDWLSGPQFVETPELQAGDSVRVVLARNGVTTFDQTVRPMPRSELETVFLKGAPEP